jgi:hypothetical protein
MFGWLKIFEATRLSDGEPCRLAPLPDRVELLLLVNAVTGEVEF